jgi:hypothetical protein
MTKEEKEKALRVAEVELRRRHDQHLVVTSEYGTVIGITEHVRRVIGHHHALDVLGMSISNKTREFNYYIINPINQYLQGFVTSPESVGFLEKIELRFIIKHDFEARTLTVEVQIYPLFIKDFIVCDLQTFEYPKSSLTLAKTREDYNKEPDISPSDFVLKLVD